MKNNYCVYKHTSPSGKSYIGITNQRPERRWRGGYVWRYEREVLNASEE